MSNFHLDSAWLEHDTKFYQLFSIRHQGGRGVVTIAHYGGKKVLPSNGDRRPISSGQTFVYTDANAYDSKLSEKRRKGYRVTPAPAAKMLSQAELRKWLTENLQTLHRDKVLKEFGLSLDPNADPIDPDDEPIGEVETINHDSDDRPEGWGDW